MYYITVLRSIFLDLQTRVERPAKCLLGSSLLNCPIRKIIKLIIIPGSTGPLIACLELAKLTK